MDGGGGEGAEERVEEGLEYLVCGDEGGRVEIEVL